MHLLCTADLHLGRSSAWMRGPDGVDRSAVGAWQRLVDRALAERADAILIAGDVFDGQGAYFETRQPFRKGLERLREKDIPVAAVAGNHDWEALPRFADQFPDSGLTLLGRGGGWWESKVLKTPTGPLTVVGWSFPSPMVLTSALAACPGLVAGSTGGPRVGLLHGDITPGSAYHPLSLADLEAGSEPRVLGHLHKHQRVGARAVYPGSPQALDFGPGERGPHGFVWLDLVEGRATISELIPLSTVRFEDEELTVTVADGANPLGAVEEEIERFAGRCRQVGGAATRDPYLASVQLRARVVLSGSSTRPEKTPDTPLLTRDERDAWQLVDLRMRGDRSPWDDADARDVAGEVARLLLGTLCEQGHWQNREVDPEWVRASELLVERATKDVLSCYRASLGRFTDIGDGSRPAPTPEQAREVARRQVAAELEELLRAAEPPREAAT